MTFKRSIPAVPADVSPPLRMFLNAMREQVQVAGGHGRGNPLDRAVTWRDLGGQKFTAAIGGTGGTGGTGGSDDTGGTPITGDVDAPTVPSSVSITSMNGGLFVRWDGLRYQGHSHTVLYMQVTPPDADGNPTAPAQLDKTTMLAWTTIGQSAFLEVSANSGAYVWVAHVNVEGTESAVHSVGGTYGVPRKDAGITIDDISGHIDRTWFEDSFNLQFQQLVDDIDLYAQQGIDEVLNQMDRTGLLRTDFINDKNYYNGRFDSYDGSISGITELLVNGNDPDGLFASYQQTVVTSTDAKQAVTEMHTSLQALSGDTDVTLDQFAQVVANKGSEDHQAQWGVKASFDQMQFGIGFLASVEKGAIFYVNADMVVRAGPDLEVNPFIVDQDTGKVYINDVVIRDAYIKTLAADSITTAELSVTGWTLSNAGLLTPRINTLEDGTWNEAYKFNINENGEMRAVNAYLRGRVETGTGSGYRAMMAGDHPTYLLWAGHSAMNDENAVVYVKKDGKAVLRGELDVRYLKGDVVDGEMLFLTEKRLYENQTRVLFSCNIAASQYLTRNLYVSPIMIIHHNDSGDNSHAYLRLYVNGVMVDEVYQKDNSEEAKWSSPLGCVLPAGTDDFTIRVDFHVSDGNSASMAKQAIMLQVFKSGESISNVSITP